VIAAIVIDIEGTTSSASSVREGLYGCTRQHVAQWLAENRSGAADSVIAGTRELAERPDAEVAEVAKILCGWLDSDVKAEPLKTAQGSSLRSGLRSGALHGELFGDVRPALSAWHARGIALYVYSSGSVRNQQDWFAHARDGELASLISGWFDLTSAGPNRADASYRRIAHAIGLHGQQILPLSDHPAPTAPLDRLLRRNRSARLKQVIQTPVPLGGQLDSRTGGPGVGIPAGQGHQGRGHRKDWYVVPLTDDDQLPKRGVSAASAPTDEYPQRRVKNSPALPTARAELLLSRKTLTHSLLPFCPYPVFDIRHEMCSRSTLAGVDDVVTLKNCECAPHHAGGRTPPGWAETRGLLERQKASEINNNSARRGNAQ
jgi:enolase-phosphatase E1